MSQVEDGVTAEGTDDGDWWLGLNHRAGTDEVREWAEREFAPGFWENLPQPSRRTFLKLMGASAAMAGLAGCRWQREEIFPYTDRPENRLPGEPVRYAGILERSGHARGVLVTTVDGRPIKVDGNPDHPGSLGGADPFDQAAILEFYDPDRSRTPIHTVDGEATERTWGEFEAEMAWLYQAREGDGAGIAVLAEASSSEALAAQRARLAEVLPAATWTTWEPLADPAARLGSTLAFGAPHRAVLHLDRSRTTVCLDADLLGTHPDAVRNARLWSRTRDASTDAAEWSRLYSFEPVLTQTGSVADHRAALRAHDGVRAAALLAAELIDTHGIALPGAVADSLRPVLDRLKTDAAKVRGTRWAAMVEQAAADLAANRGHGLVTAGPRMPAPVHALCHVLNEALGNAGATVTYLPEPETPDNDLPLADLAAAMDAGEVSTLLILGGNPAYDAPADLDFAAALDKVERSIHLSTYNNETSRLCTWHLPRAHDLEAWGDARSWDGTLAVGQPTIEPLWGGRSPLELTAFFAAGTPLGTPAGHRLVRERLAEMRGATGFDAFWKQSLHDGVVADSRPREARPSLAGADWAGALGDAAAAPSGRDVILTPSTQTWDGRYANLGWLQEMPEPLTKLTWDNAALVAPATAEAMGVDTGDTLTVTVDGRSVDLPVWIMPSQARDTVAVALGYGRTAAGRVGDRVGRNAWPLRTADRPWVVRDASLATAAGDHEFACTQEHNIIENTGRKEEQRRVPTLVRQMDVKVWQKQEEHGEHPFQHWPGVHVPPPAPLFDPPVDYSKGRQWGMAIDLSKCTGCSACVVACQAENNIPVVGKEEVKVGREMQWLRIDRYFRGDPETAEVAYQPMPCQQCETAPCETVCPVAATTHTEEGLNDMVYNRCIGTRYCSNNCPYKVRRFNWWNNNLRLSEVEKMKFNPDVTVRGRGVMEKCTYCVQRIERAKIEVRNAAIQRGESPERGTEIIPDGTFTTACAESCPTEAIVFGDRNDPDSRLAQMHADSRTYGILEMLNVRPRTRYMGRLRNRSEELIPRVKHALESDPSEAGGDHGDGGGH